MAQLAWIATPWHVSEAIGGWIRARLRFDAPTASGPTLARGERILTVAGPPDGGPAAIASTRALYYRDRDQPDQWVRIGWEEIEHARWRSDDHTLTLKTLTGTTVALHLREAGRLPPVTRDRIAATIIATSLVTIQSTPALITVRRQPGTDTLVWTVRLRQHSSHTAADTDREVDRAIRAIRADLGL
jgi:hypothetical protein